MAFPLLAAAIGAGGLLGFMKNRRAQQIEDSSRKLAAETARYSPWTGMTPGPIQHAGSMFGDVASGALSTGLTAHTLGAGGGGAPGLGKDVAQSPWGAMSAGGYDKPLAPSMFDNNPYGTPFKVYG